MCKICGLSARQHDPDRQVYVAGQGWIECAGYVPSDQVTAVQIPGRAAAAKMFSDTQAFRDKAVRDAAAKARKIR